MPRPNIAEIDHTDSELPDAQSVVLAEIAREAHRRTVAGREAGRDRRRDAFRAVRRIRHLALARARSEDRCRGAGRSRRHRSDPVHAECAAEPRRAERRGEGDAALFRQRPVRQQPRRHAAVGERRGAGAEPRRPIRTSSRASPPRRPSRARRSPARARSPARTSARGRRPSGSSLTGPKRAKAEKCLANAVYFEARSEPVRGQIAVAQVVMNRAFSGFYPNDVCGVVYQNAHRHLSCQFTFACDGIADVVNDPESWERAKRIAHETLDGKLWLPEIAKATHYHASYVQPILGARDEEARQDRPASFLSPAANGATAKRRRPGAARPTRRTRRRRCEVLL